jgi:DNA polymerase-3 subunit delta
LVIGPEDLLADRAVARLTRLARETHPDLDVTEIDASVATSSLATAASGSLFASYAVVVVANVDRALDEFVAEALAYVAAPSPDAMVVLRHAGGNRAKKLLDAVRAAGAEIVAAAAISSDREKEAFAAAEFKRLGRTFRPEAVRALVAAVGSDLRELATAVRQVAEDTAGPVTAEAVERYYGGRLETTGFKVADAAAAGQTGEALRLARHALASGLDPVVIVAALAGRLRTLAKVGWAVQARKDSAEEFGMAPWQAEQARRLLRHWNAVRLARAIAAVASADAQVKGLGGSGGKAGRGYAAERAVIAVASAAAGEF